MNWSIDRITIVGKLKDNIYYHTQNDVLILDFEQLMRVNEGNGHLKSLAILPSGSAGKFLKKIWNLGQLGGEEANFASVLRPPP